MSGCIGEIAFEVGGEPVRAALGADLAWTSDDQKIADYLNHVLGPSTEQPLHTRAQQIEYVYRVAQRLGATILSVDRKNPARHGDKEKAGQGS